MDGYHPNQIDPRPKRRKNKDNPYTIFTIGLNTNHPRYFLCFKDVNGTHHRMEIDSELFEALDQFELDDISFMNEVDRHYEQSEQTEASLSRRTTEQQDTVEDQVQRLMEAEALHKAIAQLPETQRRRLVLYYFGNFTYKQIAEMEGCTKRAIKFSVDTAIEKLKEIL